MLWCPGCALVGGGSPEKGHPWQPTALHQIVAAVSSRVRAPYLVLWRAVVLLREAVLQASVPKLIHRSDCTKDTPLASVVEESHEAHRCMPAPGELSRGK